MSKKITIGPITRLEGEAKIEIFLDEKGNVEKINQQTYDVLLKKKLIKDKTIVQQSLLTSR